MGNGEMRKWGNGAWNEAPRYLDILPRPALSAPSEQPWYSPSTVSQLYVYLTASFGLLNVHSHNVVNDFGLISLLQMLAMFVGTQSLLVPMTCPCSCRKKSGIKFKAILITTCIWLAMYYHRSLNVNCCLHLWRCHLLLSHIQVVMRLKLCVTVTFDFSMQEQRQDIVSLDFKIPSIWLANFNAVV